MKNLICISGASGVGKTTISNIISLAISAKDTIILSGDDVHRWERSDKKWEKFTHLNPEANNLDLAFEHINDLLNNKKIFRKKYNHDTGLFEKGKVIESKKNIIYEGLHALYDERIRQKANLKIFVDTPEDLKKEWKINRDTKKRGYTIEKVLETIKFREADENKYIKCQKNFADIIIRFIKKNNEIFLECEYRDESKKNIANLILEIYNTHKCFLDICSSDSLLSLVQEAGGNISYKYKVKIVISSSGISLKNINLFNGYCICDINKINKNFDSDLKYFLDIYNSKTHFSSERPSMETLLHIKMKKKFSLHSHPIFLNSLLCSKEAEKNLLKIFSDIKYQFFKFKIPGAELGNFINVEEDIIFLQNHGLIVSSDKLEDCLNISLLIEKKCKDFFGTHSLKNNIDFPLFPESAIFKEKFKDINNIIYNNIISKNFEPNFLTNQDIKKILSLETEKYRMNLK